ncbi:hypothetical protein DRQ11_05310 [candidate division KSB1 bacterium]|nr:MAG: hypothetical protein DRQ11_05310 [candidate division KSB1 bacterium]
MKIIPNYNNFFIHYTKHQIGRFYQAKYTSSHTKVSDESNISHLKNLKEVVSQHFGETYQSLSWNSQADLNGDGVINVLDKLIVRQQLFDLKELISQYFGETSQSPNWNSEADLNGDGIINVFDKILLRQLLLGK